VEKPELDKVQGYLHRLFGNPDIRLTARPQRDDMAEVHIGGRMIGLLTLDDEDGDRSFNFQMGIQEAALERVQDYLRDLFGNPKIKVLARPKKKDSAEVFIDDEFIAVLFLEDRDRSYSFQMAILDTDLE
jgi:predicted RNA-binding protein with PUA domain